MRREREGRFDPYEVGEEAAKIKPPGEARAKRVFLVGDWFGLLLLAIWGSELSFLAPSSPVLGVAIGFAGPIVFVAFRLCPMPFWPAYGLGFLGSLLPVAVSMLL